MKNFKSSLVALALTAAAATAAASTVTVTFDKDIFNGSSSDGVNITFPLPVTGSRSMGVSAGRFQGTASKYGTLDTSIFVDGIDNLFMYCYDVYEGIRGEDKVVYTVNFGGAKPRTLDFLGAVNSVMSAGMAYDPYAWLHPVNGNQGAAIQLGIWESLYDNTEVWSLTTGSFRASGLDGASGGKLATADYWNLFVGAMGSTDALAQKYTMTFEATGAQDMITGDPPTNNVPEPGSLALLGLALAGLAGSRQLRRKA